MGKTIRLSNVAVEGLERIRDPGESYSATIEKLTDVTLYIDERLLKLRETR